MSFCSSCSEVINVGETELCGSCQKPIHSWCGTPCFDQVHNIVGSFEVRRVCFTCYKGHYGLQQTSLNGSELEKAGDFPLKRSFNFNDSTDELFSCLNIEVPTLASTNLASKPITLEHTAETNKEVEVFNTDTKQNITLDTYFEISKNKLDGFARCKLCTKEKIISVKKSSFSSAKYHLQRYHTEEYQLYIKFNPAQEPKSRKNLKNPDLFGTKIQPFSQSEAVRCAVRLAVSENLSFDCLEDEFFQSIFQRSILPSEAKSNIGRDHFCLELDRYYNETNSEKLRILNGITSRISLTTDLCLAPNKAYFLGITAHWIDAEFELHNMLLSFTPTKNWNTTGLNTQIETCLKTYNLQNKILGISFDNSTSNLSVMEQLSASNSTSIHKKNYSPCLAHIFHLAAQAFVSTIKQEYNEAAEQPISFFYEISTLLDSASGSKKDTQASLSVFEDDNTENMITVKDNNFIFRVSEIDEAKLMSQKINLLRSRIFIEANQNLDPISKMVNILELLKSLPQRGSEFLKHQQVKGLKPSIIILDAKARWNSVFKMFEWAISNKDPLSYFIAQEKLNFTEKDWDFLMEIQMFLTLFEEKTDSIMVQKFSAASKALCAYEEVLLLINDTNYPSGSILSQALVNCKKKLLSYSHKLKNDIHIMGISKLNPFLLTNGLKVLDPSMKDSFYLAYEWSEKEIEEAKLKMVRIYEKYAAPTQTEADHSVSNPTKKPRAIALRESIRPTVEDELKKYLSDLSDIGNNNLFCYWKARSTVFPILGKIARDYLTACATTIPIQHEFSCTKAIFAVRKLDGDFESLVKRMELKSWELQTI